MTKLQRLIFVILILDLIGHLDFVIWISRIEHSEMRPWQTG